MFSLTKENAPALWAEVAQYYSINFRSFSMPPHRHPAWEIMLVVSGSAQLSWKIPGKAQGEKLLHEGEFLVVDSNIEHCLNVKPGSPCRMLNVELNPTAAKGIFSFAALDCLSAGLVEERLIVAYDTDACLHSCIISLQQHMKRDKQARDAQVDWILGQLVLIIARCYSESTRSRQNPYVSLAEDYINMYFDTEIQIEQIASHAGLSRAYLQRLYRRHMGCSMIERVNRLRIDKAKFLLRSSSLSVLDVGINVGFNNRQHFTHVFVSLVGCSPGEYKKKEGAAFLRQPAPSKLYESMDGMCIPYIVSRS